jgi:signal transduction histidine kinase
VDDQRWGYLAYDVSQLTQTKAPPKIVHWAMATVAGNLEAAMERQETLVRLRSANRAKDDFLANMSHELRTPLNHIIGFNELVLTEQFGELNEIQKEYLNDVFNSSKHLLSLINDILDLSKVESGKVKFEPGQVKIRELLKNSLAMVREKAQKNNIQLILENDHVPEAITADERLLKQVIYNLLGNAIKFTPGNGRICLTARKLVCAVRIGKNPKAPHLFFFVDGAPRNLDADNIRKMTCLEIAVTDTGIGISQDNLTRIFNRFDQVTSGLNRHYQGTGLGLSLAQAFIELHGGRIWAESEGADRGSKFRLVIPI